MRVSLEFNTSSPDDRSLLSSVMKSLIILCDDRTSVEAENDEQPTDADKEEETKQKEEKKNSKRRKLGVKSMDQKVVVVESDGEKESNEFACAPEPCVVGSTPSDNTAPSEEKTQQETSVPDEEMQDQENPSPAEEKPKQENPVPDEEMRDQENPCRAGEKPKSLTPQEFREKVSKLRASLGITTEKEGNMLARAITKMSEFMYQTNVPSKLPSDQLYAFSEAMMKLEWNADRTEIVEQVPF